MCDRGEGDKCEHQPTHDVGVVYQVVDALLAGNLGVIVVETGWAKQPST